MENFHHCAELMWNCAKARAKKLCLSHGLHHEKILSYPSFSYLQNFVDFFGKSKNLVDFFSNFSNFVDLFGLFGHFFDLFELVSPGTCAKIPSCTENHMALMCQAILRQTSSEILCTIMPDILGIMCIFPSLA